MPSRSRSRENRRRGEWETHTYGNIGLIHDIAAPVIFALCVRESYPPTTRGGANVAYTKTGLLVVSNPGCERIRIYFETQRDEPISTLPAFPLRSFQKASPSFRERKKQVRPSPSFLPFLLVPLPPLARLPVMLICPPPSPAQTEKGLQAKNATVLRDQHNAVRYKNNGEPNTHARGSEKTA